MFSCRSDGSSPLLSLEEALFDSNTASGAGGGIDVYESVGLVQVGQQKIMEMKVVARHARYAPACSLPSRPVHQCHVLLQ